MDYDLLLNLFCSMCWSREKKRKEYFYGNLCQITISHYAPFHCIIENVNANFPIAMVKVISFILIINSIFICFILHLMNPTVNTKHDLVRSQSEFKFYKQSLIPFLLFKFPRDAKIFLVFYLEISYLTFV